MVQQFHYTQSNTQSSQKKQELALDIAQTFGQSISTARHIVW